MKNSTAQKNWTENEEARRAVHIIAYGRLVSEGYLEQNKSKATTPWEIPEWKWVWHSFKQQAGDLNLFGGSSDCAEALVHWYKEQTEIKPKPQPTRVLAARVTRHYGELDIEFGIEESFPVVDDKQMQLQYYQLLDSIEEMHERVQAEMHLVARPAAMPAGGSASEVIVQATELVKGNRDGEDYIKIKCGDWQEFGVIAYPEFYPAIGINPDKYDYGSHEFVYRVVVAMKPDGNPKKVISLAPA